jgi:hypothetical protein
MPHPDDLRRHHHIIHQEHNNRIAPPLYAFSIVFVLNLRFVCFPLLP